MHINIIGEQTCPIALLIGTWDPPLKQHVSLLKHFVKTYSETVIKACIGIINPNPASFIAEKKHQDYFDVDSRIQLLSHTGARSFIIINMDSNDLLLSAEQFLSVLQQQIILSELWIGYNQSLGPGPNGSQESIIKYCDSHHISLRIMKEDRSVSRDRWYLNRDYTNGELSSTKKMVDYYPTFRINAGNTYAIYDGIYLVHVSAEPFHFANTELREIEVSKNSILQNSMLNIGDWIVLVQKK